MNLLKVFYLCLEGDRQATIVTTDIESGRNIKLWVYLIERGSDEAVFDKAFVCLIS